MKQEMWWSMEKSQTINWYYKSCMADIKEKYLRDLGSEIVNEGVHLIQVSLFAKETMK